MNVNQLRDLVIIPTLKHIDLHSCSAVNLLLGTAAHESNCGMYIRQKGFNVDSKEGAFGIYQMELVTHDSLWADYLDYRKELSEKVYGLKIYTLTDAENLISNLPYATAMARIKYLTIKDALPDEDDIEGMANYWKKYYNSSKGKGTKQEFIDNYNRYIEDA